MKKNEVIPVRVYRNELHEANTKRELQTAQTALQSCLNVWNSLELIPCTNIFALILNPQTEYKKAVNDLAVVPVTVGRFQLSKEAYINTLEIPIPDSLYRAAREARKVPFTNMPELWSVSGDQVVLNESEADQIINSQSIFASGEKIKLAEDLQTLCNLFNSIDKRVAGELLQPSVHATNYFLQKFSFTQQSWPGPHSLGLIPEVLKRWLSL